MEEEKKDETKSGGGKNNGFTGAEKGKGEGKLTAKGIQRSGEGQVDSDGDYHELPKEFRGLKETRCSK